MNKEPYIRATDVLYKLEAIYYQNKSHARYPRFKVIKETEGYFHTLEEAERRIQEYVDKEEQAKSTGEFCHNYFGFEIHEIPFDWHLTGSAQHTRTYLENGIFLHETKVSALRYKDFKGASEQFMGRTKEECRFEVGDMVEVLTGDTVSLEIVYHLPPSPQRAAEIRQYVRREFQTHCPHLTEEELQEEMNYALDITDDSYTTLNSDEGYMDSHQHHYITQLYPARRKIPYLLGKKLECGLMIALKENEQDLC